MTKLNRIKPFGTISGTYEDYPEARFSQNGLFFNANGDCLNETTESQGNDGKKHDDEQVDGQGHDDGQTHDGQVDDGQLDGHVETDVQAEDTELVEQEGNDGLLDEEVEEGPVMSLTDDELIELSDDGMATLRRYSTQFGVNGTSKQEIIDELRALRK